MSQQVHPQPPMGSWGTLRMFLRGPRAGGREKGGNAPWRAILDRESSWGSEHGRFCQVLHICPRWEKTTCDLSETAWRAPSQCAPMQKVSLFSIKSLPSVSLIVNKNEVRSEFIKKKKKRAKLNNQAPKEASSFFPLPSPSAKNAGNPGFIFLQLNLVMMSCVWLSRAVF